MQLNLTTVTRYKHLQCSVVNTLSSTQLYRESGFLSPVSSVRYSSLAQNK